MRIFTLQNRVGSREVYAWTLTATNAEGKEMKLYPKLAMPTSSTAGGILSTIPLKQLFIEDFVSDGAFKILLISTDGINSNKAAMRLLLSELTKYNNRL